MAHVTRSIVLDAKAADVWAACGDFQTLDSWHPAVERSEKEMIDGVEHRRLHLGGGAQIVEKLMGAGEMSYGYEITEAPLPVANYACTLNAVAMGDQTVLVWASTFDPTADGAEDVIAGVYDGGFAALAEKFSA